VGDTRLGTKTEIKNVNSFSGIEKALQLEIVRQIEVVEAGGVVRQETLLWDDHRGVVRPMRSKEGSHDYRYFPDPDLPPLVVSDDEVAKARRALPELPRERRARFGREYGLSEYDAGVLTQTSAGSEYFEAVAREADDPKAAAKWVTGPARALMKARGETVVDFPVTPAALAELIEMVRNGTISDRVAKSVLSTMAAEGRSAGEVVIAGGLEQVRDSAQTQAWIGAVVDEFPEEAGRYHEGEVRLLGFLVGKVMGRSGGKADPRQVNELLRDRLEKKAE
jgi:aspartyl-tRNA(Asn)/glutamyl-tRNA(Gln) amidotransferase subunit B